MPKKNANDLLTPDQASECLFKRVTAQAIRKRVREGDLRSYRQPLFPDKIFVSQKELETLYYEQLHGWIAIAKQNGRKK